MPQQDTATPAHKVGTVYEAMRVSGGGLSPKRSLSHHASIEGAKAAAAADHANIRSSLDELSAKERAEYGQWFDDLVWEHQQFYFNAGREQLPDGAPRLGAAVGEGTTYQIFERDLLA
jgi:hypothetical protein